VRARHLRYATPQSNPSDPYAWPLEAQSDLARIRRDHEFLRVLGAAVAKQGLGNPVTDLDLINSVKADLTFDQAWSVGDMVNLVLDFHSVNIASVPQLTLPVQVVDDPAGGGGLLYEGYPKGDVEFPAQAQDVAAVQQLLGVGATTDFMTGAPLPAPGSVSVAVDNGTGVANQAADTAYALGALGFHVATTGDTTPVGDVSETYVYYGSRDPTTEAAAESVARSMSGAVVMAYDPSKVTAGAQVTVVTGSQFAVDAPAPAGAATTTPASGPTTTAAPSAPTSTTVVPAATGDAAGNLASPNAPTSQLAPYDPRACAPGVQPVAPTPNPT
jgi:hypothetical protein